MKTLEHHLGATPEEEQLALIVSEPRFAPFGALLGVLVLGVLVVPGALFAWELGGWSMAWMLPCMALPLFGLGLYLRAEWVRSRKPDRVLTLSRERIELREGSEVRAWTARELRFVELLHDTAEVNGDSHSRDGAEDAPHRVKLVLTLRAPPVGPEDKPPQVSLRGYDEQHWNKDEARFFDTLQDALMRFEFVPPRREAPPPAAWAAAPPLLGVLETDLAPSVRAMLQGRKGLPREARFMPDRSEAHADWAGGILALALIGFVPLALMAMSLHGEFVQYNPDYLRERALAMVIHPMWTVGLMGLLGVSLCAFLAWDILRSRSVWARILSGAWRRGLYFLPDMLAQVRPGDVSVIPRDRILSLQARPGEIVIRYLSENGRLALWTMATGSTIPKWLGVEKLEHWRRSGVIRCPISTRFPVRVIHQIRTGPGVPHP